MPELPEVETIRRGLEKHSRGRSVAQAHVDGSRMFRHNPHGSADVVDLAVSRQIEGIVRRGKYMWLEFVGTEQVLVVHLGMSGKVLADSGLHTAPNKHEHLRLELDDRTTLRFVDPRTFGHLSVSRKERDIPVLIGHIAPDPFEKSFDPAQVAQKMHSSARPIKTMLLDQELVSGIGNIYADEALFRARIPGYMRGMELALEDIENIVISAREVMGEAIAVGGTSFDALYVDAQGNPGYFARSLLAYGRIGQDCLRCGTPIERMVIGGRSHFYCRACQTKPVH